MRTGASVIEVSERETGRYSIPSPGSVVTKVHGQAAAVDLPGGRTLFALLKSDDDPEWAGRVLFYVIDQQTKESRIANDDDFAVDMERVINLQGVRPLPRFTDPLPWGSKVSGYPTLVTFSDIHDPATVKRVDPDDLAAAFGPGVKLKRLTVERTDAPVTSGIHMRLTWLPTHRGTLKPNPPKFSDDPFDLDLRLLGTGPFTTERFK